MSNSYHTSRWQQQDLIDLAILYHMGVSSLQMQEVLHRSKQAIEKQLVRFGIRPPKDKYVIQKPANFFSTPTNADAIRHSLALYRLKYQEELTQTTLNTALSFLAKTLPLKRSYRSRGKRPMAEQPAKPSLEQWATTQEILSYLRRHNHKVNEMTIPSLYEADYVFAVNGKPYTKGQILRLANEIREKYKAPRFYLDGVTE